MYNSAIYLSATALKKKQNQSKEKKSKGFKGKQRQGKNNPYTPYELVAEFQRKAVGCYIETARMR